VERKGRQRSETEGPEGLQGIPAAEVAASARPLSSVVTGVGGGGGPRRDDAAAETGRRVESDAREKAIGKGDGQSGNGLRLVRGKEFSFFIGFNNWIHTPLKIQKSDILPPVW
jgi:hypothetical protein